MIPVAFYGSGSFVVLLLHEKESSGYSQILAIQPKTANITDTPFSTRFTKINYAFRQVTISRSLADFEDL